jgi:hypothetical protein
MRRWPGGFSRRESKYLFWEGSIVVVVCVHKHPKSVLYAARSVFAQVLPRLLRREGQHLPRNVGSMRLPGAVVSEMAFTL